MNELDTFISELQQATKDIEKTWLVTDMYLKKLSPDLKEAFLAAAVPHWFDKNILAALLSIQITEADYLYGVMKKFNFTERFGSLGYALHDLTRESIIWYLAKHNLNRLQAYSNCAWGCFSQFEDDPQSAVEATYHLLIANSSNGLKRFNDQMAAYKNKYNFSAVSNLTNNYKELVRLELFPDELSEFIDKFSYKFSSIEQPKMYILHLSDIHLENKSQAQIYRMQLETDLIKELKIRRLDYLVISGDITSHATENEYSAAFEMLDGLLKSFKLNSDQVVIVPGNHDLHWSESKNAYSFVHMDDLPTPLHQDKCIPAGDAGMLLRDEILYQQRFANFSMKFYKQMCGGHEYPLDYTKQAILIERPDDKVLFLALNSCWQIDHHFRQRAGINMEAISNALNHLQNGMYDGWLKIAVWHHPITGQEMINDDFMQLLTIHGFRICMHGHIHKAIEGFYKYDNHRGIHIIGAGTFGAPTKEQVTGIPLQYNLLIFDQNKGEIVVHTRKKEETNGAWSADARWGDRNNPKPWYNFYVIVNDKTQAES